MRLPVKGVKNTRLEWIGDSDWIITRKIRRLQKLQNLNMYNYYLSNYMDLYTTERSGLIYCIWFSCLGDCRNNKHTVPWVKVELPNGDLIPITIKERPTILLSGVQLVKAIRRIDKIKMKPVYDFISKNRELFMSYWRGEITNFGVYDNLKKL
jgi:hypothetical protein